jgi:hypothetical protein
MCRVALGRCDVWCNGDGDALYWLANLVGEPVDTLRDVTRRYPKRRRQVLHALRREMKKR